MDVKKYNRTTYWVLALGFVLFIIGFITYFFTPSIPAINLRTHLPTVADGSITLILGIGGLSIGIYRLLYREKIIRKHIEWEKKHEEKEEKRKRLKGIR